MDEYEADVERLGDQRPFTGTCMALAVTDPSHQAYDAGFATRFLASTRALAARLERAQALGWSYPCAPFLTSVAEEMAMWAIIQEAYILANDASSPFTQDEQAGLEEGCFEDLDFLMLFEQEKDGFADEEGPASQLGPASPDFASWFEPFRPGFDPTD
ncbi:MAG TPA: hypothetical protein VFW71_02160 [Actinomycetota bacterium]|nr:hypothetical protein [Actinomycetota bacterium]